MPCAFRKLEELNLIFLLHAKLYARLKLGYLAAFHKWSSDHMILG